MRSRKPAIWWSRFSRSRIYMPVSTEHPSWFDCQSWPTCLGSSATRSLIPCSNRSRSSCRKRCSSRSILKAREVTDLLANRRGPESCFIYRIPAGGLFAEFTEVKTSKLAANEIERPVKARLNTIAKAVVRYHTKNAARRLHTINNISTPKMAGIDRNMEGQSLYSKIFAYPNTKQRRWSSPRRRRSQLRRPLRTCS